MRTVPDFYASYLISWWYMYVFWNGVYLVLGIAGTVLPIIVAMKPTFLAAENNQRAWSGISLGAAVVTGLMTFLNPSVQAKNNHDAWLILNEATREYVEDPDVKLEKLRDAYKRGEEIISNVAISTPSNPLPKIPP
jgi:hypothetical protein